MHLISLLLFFFFSLAGLAHPETNLLFSSNKPLIYSSLEKKVSAEKNKQKKQAKEKKDKAKKIPSSKQELIDRLWKKVSPNQFAEETKNKQPAKHKKSPRPLAESRRACTVELKIEGAIAAVTLDIIDRAIYKVEKENCSALLLLINTPGGMLYTTRKIVDRILNVDFPVLCLIHPAGAHAGSAGAIILQACHVNGGISTTNLGAATPIIGAKDTPKDLRKKMINDATSWLDSLTQLRKRNKKFGREIITEAKAVNATEALKLNAIDFVGRTKRGFLNFAEGKKVLVRDGKTDVVQVGDILPFHLGFRHHLISIITDPQTAYLLFSGSLLLIYFEITHPGLGAPGILGTMGIIISFMAMHKLDFSWAGLLLIILSMALFLAEVFITGFGIFGACGIVSFALGSLLLFDPSKTGGVDIPISLIISITTIFALIMSVITWLAWSTLKLKKKSISDSFTNKQNLAAEVVKVSEDGLAGMAFIHGENWRFKSQVKVKVGDQVKVLSHLNLTLKVAPLKETDSSSS